ncbi:tetratricopeptide repeat protein 9C-like [Ruditapes philippinarum]|uniref:tetratricopeptide repeat protein 9C-like n=1 Tax=Ruditapes philippinarum TaxID=129788 RepID=UPI00295A7809|nr:tetratricopeptide repeat protein 9C-like [Ruditapes philippinarum]
MAVNKPTVISDTEKLETAKKFKSDGNECHKNKDYKHAVGKYHRALLQLKGIGSAKSAGLGAFMSEQDMEEMGYSQQVPESVRVEVTKLTADCYNNLAACLLQQPNPNYTKIIEYCDNVIELTPNNVKAYYRRGLGYCNLENYEKALESFDQAETEAGSKIDRGLRALLNKHVQICREGIKRQDQQLSKAYRGMFDSKNDSSKNG